MAKFLDETGLAKLVSLIKGYAVPLTGGTITGDLTVEGKTTVQAPTEDTDAATKAYVDEAVANAESGTLDEAVTDVTYSSGTLTVEKGDGSKATASINPVTSVSVSGTTATVSKADGTSSTFTVPEGTISISTYYTSGTTGYALFSNNFIIQWGQVNDLENNVGKVATLPHAMASTGYHLFIHRKGMFTAATSDTIYILNGLVNSATQIEVSINALSQESLTNWTMSYLVIGTAA